MEVDKKKDKLHIVIISIFCFPEKGAAPYRIFNMASEIQKAGHQVSILTAIPNYPKGKIFKEYKGKFFFTETIKNILIKRYWLYPSNSSNPFVRVFSMLSFSFSLLFSIFWLLKTKPDKIIVQSPPLLVGLTGVLIGKLLRIETILNVSDIWPHTAVDLKVMREGSFTFKFFSWIEKTMYKYSSSFICQAESVQKYLKELTNSKDVFLYRNLSRSTVSKEEKSQTEDNRIVYAGLLGIAQGVLEICQEIDFQSYGCSLHIYGDGAQRPELEELSLKRKDIVLHDSVPKEVMQQKLELYDATLIPLKTHIRGAMPSKIYMAISAQLPIFFHGKGDGADVVGRIGLGYVSQEVDFSDLRQNLLAFSNLNLEGRNQLKQNIKNAAMSDFNYEKQQQLLIEFIDKL